MTFARNSSQTCLECLKHDFHMYPHPTATNRSAPRLGALLFVAMLILIVLYQACIANLEFGCILGFHPPEPETWFKTSWFSTLSEYWPNRQNLSDEIRDLGNTTLSAGLACVAFSLGSATSKAAPASPPHYRLRAESVYTFKSVSTAVEPRPPRAEI